MSAATYRGRLAPSPTGYLHVGHARTFGVAQRRSQEHGGTLILRNDDLDRARCKPEFVAAMYEDLRWFGLSWSEGPDVGGPYAPYNQSERMPGYIAAFEILRQADLIYPCTCSRQDVMRALSAPHPGEDEAIYPGTCRPDPSCGPDLATPRRGVNWRLRVPHGELISFEDQAQGTQSQVAGNDFGDFLVWRKDDFPSYQLACVVDDEAMDITEVVRGADLINSTFRQLLLYQALRHAPPRFYHCDLVVDNAGVRLAKRHDSLSLRTLRARGFSPDQVRSGKAL